MRVGKITIFIALIIVSLSSFGQEKPAKQMSKKAIEMAKKSDEIMKESLKLTKEQIPLISEINLVFSQKAVEIYEKPGGMFGKMSEMKKSGKDRKAQLEKVLTPEQIKLFDKKVEGKMRKEMRKILREES